MAKINDVLARLILEKGGNKAEIARKLGDVTPQAIGKYANNRAIPVSFIKRWKAVYGEDLIELSETNGSQWLSMVKGAAEEHFQDRIFHGDYIGMHNRAWNQLEETLNTQRELLREASRRNSELVIAVSKMVEVVASSRANRSK